MNIKDVQNILHKHHRDIAFVIGNGINRHYNEDNISWTELLLDLWDELSFQTKSKIPKGISFTEFYDALEIQNADKHNFSSVLQKSVKSKMAVV